MHISFVGGKDIVCLAWFFYLLTCSGMSRISLFNKVQPQKKRRDNSRADQFSKNDVWMVWCLLKPTAEEALTQHVPRCPVGVRNRPSTTVLLMALVWEPWRTQTTACTHEVPSCPSTTRWCSVGGFTWLEHNPHMLVQCVCQCVCGGGGVGWGGRTWLVVLKTVKYEWSM